MSDPSLAKDNEMVYSPHNSPTLKPPLLFPLRTEQRIPLIDINTNCGQTVGDFLGCCVLSFIG